MYHKLHYHSRGSNPSSLTQVQVPDISQPGGDRTVTDKSELSPLSSNATTSAFPKLLILLLSPAP